MIQQPHLRVSARQQQVQQIPGCLVDRASRVVLPETTAKRGAPNASRRYLVTREVPQPRVRIDAVIAAADEQRRDIDEQPAACLFAKLRQKCPLGHRALHAQGRGDWLCQSRPTTHGTCLSQMRGARPKVAGSKRQGGDTAESNIIHRRTAQRVDDESRIGGLAHAREGCQSSERNCLRRRAQQRRGSNDEGNARSKPGNVRGRTRKEALSQDLDAPDGSGLRFEPSGGRTGGESDSSHYHSETLLVPHCNSRRCGMQGREAVCGRFGLPGTQPSCAFPTVIAEGKKYGCLQAKSGPLANRLLES